MQAIWDGVREGMGWLLAFFYSIIPNAGISIILLTVLVRLVLFPLTAKQAKSMIAMQRAQPEIKKLQAKYKNDRQKLNEEMMKFYKENQINPLGGCLPLLAQMPVFFALYETLRDIQKFIPTNSAMYADICSGPGNSCKHVSMPFLGMNLTQSASSAPKGFMNALPYFVLVGLVVVTAFLQQRQTMRTQTQVNPQMQIIGKVMPVIFGFISINLPAGVVLYFLTSNLWQIGQQEVVFRTIGTAAGPPTKKGAIEAKSTEKKPVEKSPPAETGGGTGGVKGLFKSLSAGTAATDSEPNGNGAPPASGSSGAKGSGSGASSGGGRAKGSGTAAKKPATKQASTGAKKAGGQSGNGGGSGAKSGSQSSNRRRNNRKRKR